MKMCMENFEIACIVISYILSLNKSRIRERRGAIDLKSVANLESRTRDYATRREYDATCNGFFDVDTSSCLVGWLHD